MAFGDRKGGLSASVNSVTNPTDATGSVSVAVGDLVWVNFAQQTNLTATGVTDNLGNSYSAVNAGTDAGTVSIRCFYSRVTVAGTLTTVSVAASASTNDASCCVDVIEGPFVTSPLDANPANATDATSPFTCPATGTLAQADEVVMAAISVAANTTVAATSPDVIGTTVARANVSSGVSRRVVSATTSVTPEFTGTSATASQTTASFKKDTAVSGSASFSGSGAVDGTGQHQGLTSASTDGSGTVAATGQKQWQATADVSGSGTVDVTGQHGAQDAVSVAGSGTLASSVRKDAQSSSSVSGTGDVTVEGSATGDAEGTAAIGGSGALAVTVQKHAQVSASCDGAGACDCVGSKDSVNEIGGSGTVAVSGSKAASGTATVTASSDLAAVGGSEGHDATIDGVGNVIVLATARLNRRPTSLLADGRKATKRGARSRAARPVVRASGPIFKRR